LLKAITIF